METKRIFLVRHGETNFNIEGIVQGRLIDSDLNDTGVKQSKLLCQLFFGKKIDHIYLSTLKRTYQTMEPLINNGIPFSCEKDLDEFCFGTIEGTPIFDEQGNSILKKVLIEWKNGDYQKRFEGGESPVEAIERVKNGFNKIFAKNNEKQIIVCLHQRILRIVMCYLLRKPLSEMDKYPHHNTGISIVDFDLINNQFVLIELDNHSHLVDQ